MSEAPKRGNYLTQAWLVILLAFLYGGGLAGVQALLGGRIAENIRNETYKVIPDLVEGADRESTREVLLAGADGKEVRIYMAMTADGEHRGWVFPGGGPGFADRIEMLVAVDANVEVIRGVYVLQQKETPGLGNYIVDEEFRSHFQGHPTDTTFRVVTSDPRDPSEIPSLTGATISSESVSTIVNNALANFKEPVRRYMESNPTR